MYYSVDTVLEKKDAVHFPTEFLNSLTPSGVPPHTLILKIGAPIILMRNLSPPTLCNGTRLQIKKLRSSLLECIILTGCGNGKTVLIPRIPIIPSDLPFKFKRIQLPIKLAFAMTINKAQGQTLNVVGIDLSVQCFFHGQLYVALSRVTSKFNLYIFAPDPEKVDNVVYKEIF
jgi:ATP-dependent DNA helicase PIF1